MTYKIEITPITILAAVEEYIVGDGNYAFEITYTSLVTSSTASVNENVSEYSVEVFEIAQGEQGEPGPQGPPGDSVIDIVEFTQASPTDSWLINHNFGRLPINVTIYSVGGQEVEADVLNLNSNQTQINFAIPFAGSARVL